MSYSRELEVSKAELKKAEARLQGSTGEEREKAIFVINTWMDRIDRYKKKSETRGLSSADKLRIATIVKDINNIIRKHFKQEKSNVEVSEKAVEYCLIYGFSPVESWERWKKARTDAGWTYGPYNQEKKTHPNLIENYNLLPFEERVKDYTFYAAVEAACRILEIERRLF